MNECTVHKTKTIFVEVGDIFLISGQPHIFAYIPSKDGLQASFCVLCGLDDGHAFAHKFPTYTTPDGIISYFKKKGHSCDYLGPRTNKCGSCIN